MLYQSNGKWTTPMAMGKSPRQCQAQFSYHKKRHLGELSMRVKNGLHRKALWVTNWPLSQVWVFGLTAYCNNQNSLSPRSYPNWVLMVSAFLSVSNAIRVADDSSPQMKAPATLPLCLLDRLLGGFLVFGNGVIQVHAHFAHKCSLSKFICEAHRERIWRCVSFLTHTFSVESKNTFRLKLSFKKMRL